MLVERVLGSVKVALTTLVTVLSVVEDIAEQYPVMYVRVVVGVFIVVLPLAGVGKLLITISPRMHDHDHAARSALAPCRLIA